VSDIQLMKGNEALAEAAIRAGCQGYFGYPITPQSEILEYLAEEGRELGRGREIAVAAELARAGAVVAETGLVERELHVAREAHPAATRRDLVADAGSDALAVRACFGTRLG